MEEKFDLIVSNPPFFPDHLKSSDSKRNLALHTDELSFEELIEKTKLLLSPSGAFWVILPPRQTVDLETLAEGAGLFLFQKTKIRDTAEKPVYREISGFSFLNTENAQHEILLKDENMAYTGSYSALLSGFLLGYN